MSNSNFSQGAKMGRHATSDVVPFKITPLVDGDTNHPPDTANVNLKVFLDLICEDEYVGAIKEWKFDYNKFPMLGKNKRLHGTPFVKGDKTVYYVNEHEYSNVGGETSTFCSNNEESLIEFCNDWGFDDIIERNKKVHMTD
jgi:hypothetical protein